MQTGSELFAIPRRVFGEISANTHAGYGSTNANVKYFTNLASTVGTAMSVASNDAVRGFSVKILVDGIYAITFTASPSSTGNMNLGIFKNPTTTELAQAPNISTWTNRLAFAVASAVSGDPPTPSVAWHGILRANDIIYCTENVNTPANTDRCWIKYTFLAPL